MLPTSMRFAGLVVLVFCLSALPLRGETKGEALDRVVFVNGDLLSGHLRSADVAIVHLESPALGDVSISWRLISEVRARNSRWKMDGPEKEQQTAFADFQWAILRRTTSGVIVEVDSNTVAVPNGSSVIFEQQEHRTAGMVQLMNTKEPPAQSRSSLAISLNAPESVVLGSQSQEVFGGNLRIRHNLPDLCGTPSWASALLAGANHNKSYKIGAPAVVTDTYDGTVTLKNGFAPESSVSGLLVADFYGNSSLGISLQESFGAGVSGVVYSNECKDRKPVIPTRYRLTASGDASVRYIHQRLYAPGRSEDLAGVRLNESLVYVPLFGGGNGPGRELFAIDQALWVTPMLNDGKAVQAGGSLNISFPLNTSLSISVGGEDEFINNAPKAKRKNYVKSAMTVTYTFPAPK